ESLEFGRRGTGELLPLGQLDLPPRAVYRHLDFFGIRHPGRDEALAFVEFLLMVEYQLLKLDLFGGVHGDTPSPLQIEVCRAGGWSEPRFSLRRAIPAKWKFYFISGAPMRAVFGFRSSRSRTKIKGRLQEKPNRCYSQPVKEKTYD